MKQIQGIFFRDFSTSYIPEILKELYRDAIYEPFLSGRKDLVMLDLGGNIGLWSFYASQYAKQIYCVEPSQAHQEVIKQMLSFNKIKNVTPVQVAVSHQDGEATFYHNENVTMYSLKQEVNNKPEEAEKVRTVTLKTLFDELKLDHVDFMKMDIEGSESEVFGSQAFAEVAQKIDTCVGEFHTWSGVNPKQFETYFLDNGFSFRWLNATEAQTFVAQRI